ncbi:unnamed protein product, partial [Ilex paraguariensis]
PPLTTLKLIVQIFVRCLTGRGKVATNFIDLVLNPTLGGVLGSIANVEVVPIINLFESLLVHPLSTQTKPLDEGQDFMTKQPSNSVGIEEEDEPVEDFSSITEL